MSFEFGEIREAPTGVSFVATRPIARGTSILTMRGMPVINQNNRKAVTRGPDSYWMTEGTPVARLDHSCSPNAAFRFDTWDLVALRDIKPDEAVTFDYNTTEYTVSCPFACLCGDAQCHGVVRGFRFLPAARKEELRHLVPAWFHDKDRTYPPRACVLLPIESPTRSAFERDYEAPLREAGFQEVDTYKVGLSKATLPKGLNEYDFVLNLFDLSEPMGEHLTRYLTECRVPFSGERLRRYDPTRKELKLHAIACSVNTPPSALVNKVLVHDEAAALAHSLGGFPVFVKSQHGGDSIGITERSCCATPEELCEQSKYWMDLEGGCMVERFIDGDEFSVLVFGNKGSHQALRPVKYRFDRPTHHFLTESDKWSNWAPHWEPCPASDQACEALMELSKRVFKSFCFESYCRLDWRRDRATGRLYLLDINPNCSAMYREESTMETILRVNDWSKGKFLVHVHALAQERCTHDNEREWLEVRYSSNHGLGVFATRSMVPGEIIWKGEERAVPLVTEQWVQQRWGKADRVDFERYAYPLGPQVYGLWDESALEWRPFNHSCDPSAWFDGLNVVARRPVNKGDEITLHYASFLRKHPVFNCECGAATCHRVIDLESIRLPADWEGHLHPGIVDY